MPDPWEASAEADSTVLSDAAILEKPVSNRFERLLERRFVQLVNFFLSRRCEIARETRSMVHLQRLFVVGVKIMSCGAVNSRRDR